MPATDEGVSQLRSGQGVEYYSALKREGIPRCASTWMNLGDITPVKSASHQTTNTSWFHSYEVPRGVQCPGTEATRVVPGRGGE